MIWRLILAVMLSLLSGTAYAANEARCTELGANCICSEPMNTATWVATGDRINPSDTVAGVDKECTNEGALTGAVLQNGAGFVDTPISSGAAFTAMPAGHTLTYVLKSPDGAGTGSISHKFATTDPSKRRGIRFYRYFSSDFQFTDGTAPLCNSGKWGQVGYNGTYTGGPMFTDNEPGNFYDINTAYGWSNSMQANCCSSPVGSSGTVPAQAQRKGKWWRYEYYVNNTKPGDGVATFEAYTRNITDNGPDIRTTLSSQTMMVGPNSTYWWETPMTDGLTATSEQRDFAINTFRSNNGDACPGYFAHSYALWAAWDTNAGQRIGAATEIEGSGAQTYSSGLSGGFLMQGVVTIR